MMVKSLRYGAFIGSLLFGTMLCVLWINSAAKAEAYKEIDVKDGGTIAGVVKFDGDAPAAKMLKVDKDEQTCGHDNRMSEELVINGESKGIKNAVVSLVEIASGKKAEVLAVSLDQKECLFIPHVLAVSVGTNVDLLNSDNVMHNLHSWSIKNPGFNEGVSGGGKMTKKFDLPEIIKITCDVHKWMSSFIVVKANPYFAVTDENGRFKIENVPAGSYKIEAWQEKLGKKTVDVTVKSKEETTVDFVYTKK
ncbi:MAG: carboxypeptidase regulatory-like domain-containing protein [Planctomycetia bacterium]|nr:carboxypeptidase regulatory-like domain-containing protein [Candidatus Brocadia sapporoensis]MCC7239844.1 carboxypeptidase regulatory-like domain-containing protein [Candidatus Brocadia sp.]QOJ07725.1 MAG: carboxypeptidase regulatory-like domain-containing protein [Planctomycetia bacterium]HQU31484.1 carboxypeptidase regulatory-like domain-containing protein [Candidatus Brocadia sapporoensis]